MRDMAEFDCEGGGGKATKMLSSNSKYVGEFEEMFDKFVTN